MNEMRPYFNDQSGIFKPFNTMLERFYRDPWLPFLNDMPAFKVDVREETDQYVVEADMPGVSKEDVVVDFDDGRLTIGISKQETTEKTGAYIHKERRYESCRRTVCLPEGKEEGIHAGLENGLLRITVPKGKEKKRNRIEIS